MMKKPKDELNGFQGMTFGTIDAIINVLGIVIGLSVIDNRLAVIIGLIASGIANSFGNAVGFHVSEEAEGIHTQKEVWKATFMSGFSTFAVTLILLVPLLLFAVKDAILITSSLGILFIIILSVLIGKAEKQKPAEIAKIAAEYVGICMAVVILSYYIGSFVNARFI